MTGTTKLWHFPTKKETNPEFVTSHVQFQERTLPVASLGFGPSPPSACREMTRGCGHTRNSPAGSSPLGHAHITPESSPQTPSAARSRGGGRDMGFPHGCPHCSRIFAWFVCSSRPCPAGWSQHSSTDCSYMLSQATQSKARLQPFIWRWFSWIARSHPSRKLACSGSYVCALQVSNKYLKIPPRFKYPAANPASIGQCHFDFHCRLHLPQAPELSIHKEQVN